MVYFVEQSTAAADLIAANLKSLGIAGGFRMVKSDVQKGLRQMEGSGSVADFVFLDPPYSLHEEYTKTLGALAQSKLLGETSVVIAEHQKRFDPGEEFGELRRYRTLVQGDAALSFYRRLVTQSS
jgi:16S rRNA G966 N2-methylase RsmD